MIIPIHTDNLPMIFHSTTLLLATVQWFGFAGSTCVFPRPSLGHNRFPDERIWTGMGALGQLDQLLYCT